MDQINPIMGSFYIKMPNLSWLSENVCGLNIVQFCLQSYPTVLQFLLKESNSPSLFP